MPGRRKTKSSSGSGRGGGDIVVIVVAVAVMSRVHKGSQSLWSESTFESLRIESES